MPVAVFRIVFLLLLFFSLSALAQLKVNSSLPVQEMVQKLAGSGVKVSNIRLNCPSDKLPAYGYFIDNTGTIGIEEGILLSTGAARNALGPNNSAGASQSNGNNYQDPDLLPLLSGGEKQFDACVLEFDVQVFADTLSFDYVFASEEYKEFIRDYHDVFGFFISGPGIPFPRNLALVPGSNLPVSVQNINQDINPGFFLDNGTGETPFEQLFLQYDGYTRRLTSKIAVIPCQTYSVKLAICDVQDDAYDAGIFIAGKSLQTRAPLLSAEMEFSKFNHAIEGCNGTRISVKRQTAINRSATYFLSYQGSCQRNLDYSIVPDSLAFAPGETEKTFFISFRQDSLYEGDEFLRIAFLNPCPGLPEISSLEIRLRETFDFDLPDRLICSGQKILLNPAAAPGYRWSWSPPNGLSCTDCPSPECSISRDVIYRCILQDSMSACAARDSFSVKVVPGPAAAFSVAALAEISSIDFRFSDESENSDARLWNFGDGNSSDQQNPVHYFSSGLNRDSVNFTVTLTAISNATGCRDSLQKEIIIRNPLFIPNLITPDGDEKNQTFAPAGMEAGTWSLEVCDRWGKQVYYSPAYQLDWQGTGKPGSYFYRLRNPLSGREFRGWLRVEIP